MYKMKIVLDDKKIDEDKKYNKAAIYDAIASLIKSRKMFSDVENWYIGNLTCCSSLITTLGEQPWFRDYVTEWILLDIKNDRIEDILKKYKEQGIFR